MSSKAATVADYLAELPPERRAEIEQVRDAVNAALPEGYCESMAYGMIGWAIPLEDYPNTYNGQPLAYAGLAAQKNGYSLYLNCVYASEERTRRLHEAWAATGKKLDMGKSCIRFKRADDLALDVIQGEIAATTPAEFLALYEGVEPPAR
ncbi:MAG: DUF1801 domain-containing protein [Pseudomonadota bacterium]|nr:DUF1801 domain-containing protein [Pseudomonadota bacterium]